VAGHTFTKFIVSIVQFITGTALHWRINMLSLF